jgi:hypothetical protein
MKLRAMPILAVYADSQVTLRDRVCTWVDRAGSEAWSGFVVWKWRAWS